MPAPREESVPQQTLNTIFEKLGGVEAVAREAKHAANNASQKIDVVAGKVDNLAIVVATQGHLQEDVEDLKREVNDLLTDKHRREGALGLTNWFLRNWPTLIGIVCLALIVLKANGKI